MLFHIKTITYLFSLYIKIYYFYLEGYYALMADLWLLETDTPINTSVAKDFKSLPTEAPTGLVFESIFPGEGFLLTASDKFNGH